jgi:hypothetical protein
MGFAARTVFWLGLVYSAIPLDFGSLFSDRASGVADLNPLAVCAEGVTGDCRRRVGDLRKALDAATALGILDSVAASSEAPASKDKAPPRKPPQSRAN